MSLPAVPFESRPDDVCLIAYPKSGSNLLLFILCVLLYRTKIDWSTKAYWVQTVGGPIIDAPSPRLVWTHSAYDAMFPKVVYVVRDPRDVVISYYHHHRKYYSGAGWSQPFGDFFRKFLADEVWPGAWDRHVEDWLAHGDDVPRGLLLVRYEDMLGAPTREARRLAQFLDLDRTAEDLEKAVAWASFDNMRALEVQQPEHVNRKRVDVDAAGFVRLVAGDPSFVSLSGISFRAQDDFPHALVTSGGE
jgi:Sulfotransferase domain